MEGSDPTLQMPSKETSKQGERGIGKTVQKAPWRLFDAGEAREVQTAVSRWANNKKVVDQMGSCTRQ